MEKEKTMTYGLKKTKYMMVKTGKEREQMEENVKSGTVKKIEAFQYLGITINEEGNPRRTKKVVTRR